MKLKRIDKNNGKFSFLTLELGFLLIEIIFRITGGFSLLDWSMLRIVICVTFLCSILSFILSFTPKKVSRVVVGILLLGIGILGIAQSGMFNYFGTYMSLGTAAQAGAVGYFVIDFFSSLHWYHYFMLLPFVLYVMGLFLWNYLVKREYNKEQDALNQYLNTIKKRRRKKYVASLEEEENRVQVHQNRMTRIIQGICFVISIPLFILSITVSFMQNGLQSVSNISLFLNPTMSNVIVSQYGLLGYEMIDIKSLVIPSIEIEEDTSAYQTISEDLSTNSTVGSVDYTRYIDDTAWEEATLNETNTDYKKLSQYYMSKTITNKNEYTGYFEGKNVIVIMIESGSSVLYDYPEYFPNFNKLASEGWNWTNAFSPRNSCATGNNEFTGMTSLYSINETCTVNTYVDNTYYEAIFNLFNNKGYTTQSYHDYTDHFYARTKYHPNMGSGKYYGADALKMTYLGTGNQPWPSDVEFVEKSVPTYIDEDQFMVWMTTVSSHMTYLKSSVTGDMYLDLFSEEDWSTTTKRYMSKLKIVDNAIGELVQELSDAGKLEDTVIVLFADHEPYGLSTDQLGEVASYDVTSYGNVDRTPFVIYNPSLEAKTFDEYTTYVNILPTLANLFNLDYDPRVYAGTDLMSSDYLNVATFTDGSWRSDIGYYDASKGTMTYFGEETYTDEMVSYISKKISTEMKMDNLAIKKNYFAYLATIK